MLIVRECSCCLGLFIPRHSSSRYCNPACFREKRKRKNAAYYLKAKERINANNRAWDARNRDKRKQILDRYREKHRCRLAERQAAYRSANAEHAEALRKAFEARYSDRRRILISNRRAALRRAPGKFTTQEWVARCAEFGNKCIDCGRSDVKLTIGHLVPISRGGSNWITNVAPQCITCNKRQATSIHPLAQTDEGKIYA